MDLKKKKLTRVVKWFALLEQIPADMQWHHEAGIPSSPTQGSGPEDSHWDAVHSLVAHQSQALSPASVVSDRLLVPLQKWRRSTTVFHQVPLGTETGKKGAEDIHHLFLTGYSGPVSCPVLSAACLHTFALFHIRYNKVKA